MKTFQQTEQGKKKMVNTAAS